MKFPNIAKRHHFIDPEWKADVTNFDYFKIVFDSRDVRDSPERNSSSVRRRRNLDPFSSYDKAGSWKLSSQWNQVIRNFFGELVYWC
jgi:hypothetical protein